MKQGCFAAIGTCLILAIGVGIGGYLSRGSQEPALDWNWKIGRDAQLKSSPQVKASLSVVDGPEGLLAMVSITNSTDSPQRVPPIDPATTIIESKVSTLSKPELLTRTPFDGVVLEASEVPLLYSGNSLSSTILLPEVAVKPNLLYRCVIATAFQAKGKIERLTFTTDWVKGP